MLFYHYLIVCVSELHCSVPSIVNNNQESKQVSIFQSVTLPD